MRCPTCHRPEACDSSASCPQRKCGHKFILAEILHRFEPMMTPECARYLAALKQARLREADDEA